MRIDNSVFTAEGRRYWIGRRRLGNMMHVDDPALRDKTLWFVKDLETHDYPVVGLDTAQEALEAIGPEALRAFGRD